MRLAFYFFLALVASDLVVLCIFWAVWRRSWHRPSGLR